MRLWGRLPRLERYFPEFEHVYDERCCLLTTRSRNPKSPHLQVPDIHPSPRTLPTRITLEPKRKELAETPHALSLIATGNQERIISAPAERMVV